MSAARIDLLEDADRMPYVLGIDIGASSTKAAIRRLSGAGTARSESLLLGADSEAAPTVLHVAGDGSVAVGEAAEGCDPQERDRIIRGFSGRIGDETPLMLGEQVYPAEQLLATMIAWVVDQAIQTIGERPDHVTISHPPHWSQFRVGLLRAATDQVRLPATTLRVDLVAAALDYAAECQLAAGELLAVCDLGASAVRAAILRRTPDNGFEVVGGLEQAEPEPASCPDEAVLAQVRAELGPEIDAIDPDDPIGWQCAVALRKECALAAEALTLQPQVAIRVPLPAGQAQIVMTRAQLDEAARPAGDTAARLLRQAIRSASIHPWQLSSILLAGGSARSPLISQAVSTALHRTVAVAANPSATVAKGAAVAAALAARPGQPLVGKQLARRGPGTALARRTQAVSKHDETMVLMPDYLSEEIDDFDEPEPPRPPLEITPLDLGLDKDGDRRWWQRLAMRGSASAVLVLALALTAAVPAQHSGHRSTPAASAGFAAPVHNDEDHS